MFTFPVVDLTRFEKREFFNVYTPSQSNLLNYDFWFEEDSGHKSYIEAGLLSLKATTAGFNFGFQIGYKKYALEVRYVLDGRNVYQFDSLSEVRYKMHSMYVLIYF